MDFGLTPEQEKMVAIAKKVAEEEFAPHIHELDENPSLLRNLFKKVCELGVGVGIIIPRKYGGNEAGHLTRMLVNIEFSKVYAPMGLVLQTVPMGLWALLHFGNEEQREKYILPVVKGERMACLAITEPTGGSDVTTIRTTAKKVGKEYIVNGSKVFITLAPEADFCIFTAKTKENPSEISLFLVEKGTEGFIQRVIDKRRGLQGAQVGNITFKDCKIPEENLIGKEGQGIRAALKSVVEVGRLGNTALAIGIAESAFEKTLKFLKERKLYGGKPLAGLQTIQFELVNMRMEIEASKLLAYRAAWLLDQGKTGLEAGGEIATAKVYSSETAKKVAFKVISLCGAYGTLTEFNLVKFLEYALETDPAAGANNICRMLIGRELTGVFTIGG
ncbi:hypothetical protein DRO26_00535 [Candidatus Bathyarchaeota archaeon]|nr:MAG: hypothetical protein DRO26_00535 [Candidatus Bathyarchaeota archaeon]